MGLLKNTSTNKYVDDISFRELFGRIKVVFFLQNKILSKFNIYYYLAEKLTKKG